ncbi:acyltransferase [Nocardioides flavescens]|uniref:Acyltransferase n=1 Tax=Nocardioides flavescens TaxID=2691959 RepID=A0A6L7EW27_9ACTN|nr:acyltransferase [Nocardioides flavescens]MXG89966.1 acyltransferase [Nocardioides flavescens]
MLRALPRLVTALTNILDPLLWLHLLKVVNAHGYAHARQRRRLTAGPGLAMAPSVSLRNAERISIGERGHIGERCSLWAGDGSSRIVLGDHVLLAPEVFITASNYGTRWGTPVMDQDKIESDVHIGDGCWLGAKVVVLPGVTLGEGVVVGAASTVTRDLPAGSICVGTPARVVGWREDFPAERRIS